MNMAPPLLCQVFRNLDRVAVEYCVLRGDDELHTPSVSQQVELLLRASHRRRFAVVVEAMGFVPWQARDQGHRRSYLAYDPEDDCWLELHVVESLRYGAPARCLEVPVARAILSRRRRRGVAWMPAPEDELLTRLLHCVLEARRFRAADRLRLQALWEHLRSDPEAQSRLFSCLASRFGAWPMLAVVQGFDLHDWDDLLRQRRRWTSRLFLRQPLAVLWWRLASLLPWRQLLFFAQRQGTTTVLASSDAESQRTLAAALARDPWLQARIVSRRERVPAGGAAVDGKQAGRRTRRLARWMSAPLRLVADWCCCASGRLHALLGRTVVFEHDEFARARAGRRGGWPWEPDLVLLLEPAVAMTPGGPAPESVRPSPWDGGGEARHLAVVDTAAGADAVRRAAIARIWKRRGAIWGNRRRASWRTISAPRPVAPAAATAEGARVIS